MHAQVNESFADGDFTVNPAWVGDLSNWKVTGFQLNSNVTAASHSYIATANALAQSTQWEFFINLKFATSSLNYTDIFLISDSSNLEGLNSGIFVRAGNTADDICLYRKDGSIITKIIDGLDGRVGSSSNNIFKIKITRTSNNEFRLYDDASGTGNAYVLEGSVFETAYQTTAWFGFLIKFSTANTQKFFFDDIVVSAIVIDTSAPKLDSVWAEDSLHCVVKFNEAIDTITAVNISNFTLNGIINPISAKKSSSDNTAVVLLFASPFTVNILNTLQVNNVKDLSGNIMIGSNKSFKYTILQNGDIVINEIFADPSPAIGLPAYEYIELWNTSTTDINLQGIQLTDGSSTALFPNYVLAKDSFLIVSSTASLNAYASFGNSIMLTGFPSLNNDGDNLQLFSKQNQIIDEVNYDLSWYNNSIKSDGGWTLELINPKLRCKKKYNWSASNNPIGGTPGKANSVYDAGADTVAPLLVKFQLINDSMAMLVFNSVMDSATVSQISISSTHQILSKNVISTNADSLILFFNPLQNQVTYSFTFYNAYSCNGIKMRATVFSFTYDKSYAAQFNGIVISEVLVNPLPQQSLPNSQYIELYNRSNYSVNLKGMKISDGISTTTLPNYKLMKDSFILIAPATKAIEFTSKIIPALFPYLNIDNDQLTLTDSLNSVINSMSYNIKMLNNLPKSKGGWSIELVDANNTCMANGNWLYSTSIMGGTPGKENSVKGITNDTTILKFIRAYTIGFNEVVLIFNKAVDLDASKIKTLFEFTPALNSNYNIAYYKNNLNEISIQFQSAVLQKDTVYSLKIKNIKDCQGNTMDSTVVLFGYPSLPQYGDIAVNEILFNAKSYASEFIELYNNSEKIFDVNALTLESFNKTGISSGAIAASNFPFQLLPKQYIGIAANSDDIIHRFYSPSPENIFTNADWKSLDDDSGLIIIADLNTSTPIDSIYYSKDWHHPYISNDEGVSLERVNFNRDGKNRNNWLSAASAVGYATPAYQNSKYSNTIAPDNFVYLTKTYFTPDDDGVDDELNFSIVLPSQNYSLNITVYDLSGNEIKKLARNDIAAVTNYYTWNGSTVNGTLANTGHYILFIQATDGNGNTRTAKEVVDLLMR
jgi:hypothetical protein